MKKPVGVLKLMAVLALVISPVLTSAQSGGGSNASGIPTANTGSDNAAPGQETQNGRRRSGSSTGRSVYPRMIFFSGYNWYVKSETGQIGPGPNYFSDSTRNVWVDNEGRLHLRITRRKNRWTCAEIISASSFGHGTYRFYLDSQVDNLDPNVVLGLFTWSDDPAYSNREIDVEFSRWSDPSNENAQYVVQPYTSSQNIHRFIHPAGLAQTTHSFLWKLDSVFFQSIVGHNAAAPALSSILQEWTFTGSVPPAGGENARMNLWLYKGVRPTDGLEVEVIVNRFEFVPSF